VRSAIVPSCSLLVAGLALAGLPGACTDYPEVVRPALGEGTAGAGAFDGFGRGGSSASATGGTRILSEAGVGDADTTDTRIDPDATCASEVVSGDLKPANLLFVVDQSGSMNCNLPEDGQSSEDCEAWPEKLDPDFPSKWELTRNALEDAFDALQESGLPVSVGLTMFPVADTLCGVRDEPDVPIARLNDAQNEAIDDFLATVDPGGNTPLAGATILAYRHLFEQMRAGALTGNVFVVLITDGFETCKEDELDKLLGQDVPNAYDLLNIRTFVIGAPGSEDARALLSQIAWAGGTAPSAGCDHDAEPADVGNCHFDMTESENFAEDLAETLEQISGTVLTCELDVPTNPTGGGVDLNQVNVDINDKQYSPTDCSEEGNSGWQYTDDNTRIILCGEACDEAQQPNATVSIVLGCPTRQPE
jgi:hypothetical protein